MATKSREATLDDVGFVDECISIQHERGQTSISVTAVQFACFGEHHVFGRPEGKHRASLNLYERNWVECDEDHPRWDRRKHNGQPVYETFREIEKREFDAKEMTESDLRKEVIKFISDTLDNPD